MLIQKFTKIKNLISNIIQVGSARMNAHRCILAQHSVVFRSMFAQKTMVEAQNVGSFLIFKISLTSQCRAKSALRTVALNMCEPCCSLYTLAPWTKVKIEIKLFRKIFFFRCFRKFRGRHSGHCRQICSDAVEGTMRALYGLHNLFDFSLILIFEFLRLQKHCKSLPRCGHLFCLNFEEGT